MSIWNIPGNFWLRPNILDEPDAGNIARGVLLLSQANYFAARACLILSEENFTQLGTKEPPKRFIEQVKKGEVPSWSEMAKYLPETIQALRSIPDQYGAVILSNLRDSAIDSISNYVAWVTEVTPLRNAICHGVLTKNDDGDTVLHPTDGKEPFILKERVLEFVNLSYKTYSAAAPLQANLLPLFAYTPLGGFSGEGWSAEMEISPLSPDEEQEYSPDEKQDYK